MTLSEVLQLLALLGGAVYVTFQISWTIFTHLHTCIRNDRPKLLHSAVILMTSRRS